VKFSDNPATSALRCACMGLFRLSMRAYAMSPDADDIKQEYPAHALHCPFLDFHVKHDNETLSLFLQTTQSRTAWPT